MPQALTSVYLSGKVPIDSHLCEGAFLVSNESAAALLEQVGSRYAEAARAVLNPAGKPAGA